MSQRMSPGKVLLGFLAIAVSCNTSNGQAQNKFLASILLDSAATMVANGDHGAAASVFKEAFTLDPWDAPTYIEAVASALAANDPDAANRFLSLGVQHGFDPTFFIGAEDLKAHLASEASLPFRTTWQQDKRVFGAVADSVFIKQLDFMVVQDQLYRGELDSMAVQERIDSLNFEYLIRYCENNGFPQNKFLGHSFGRVWLLLWHHTIEEYPVSTQWQRMLPFIHKAMDDGTLGKDFLCMFDDFADEAAGRPMRFGALLYYFDQYPEKLYFVPRDELNRNRASVGWGSIENAAIQGGVDLSKARFAEP